MVMQRKVKRIRSDYETIKEKGRQFSDVYRIIASGKYGELMEESDKERFFLFVAFAFVELPAFCKRAYRVLGRAMKKKLRKMPPEEQGEFIADLIIDIAKNVQSTKKEGEV
jgi:hypothetical protein